MERIAFALVSLFITSNVYALGKLNDTARETNREVARTFANHFLQVKDFASAQDVLVEHLRSDLQDSGAWNILGLTYLESGNVKRAAKSFAKAVQVSPKDQPERGIYLYNYADSLVRFGSVKKSKSVLMAARSIEQFENAADTAIDDLKAYEPLPPLEDIVLRKEKAKAPKRPLAWTISLTSGFDSNVTLISDDSLLNNTATDQASPSLNILSNFRAIERWDETELRASVTPAFTYYLLSDVQTLNSFATSARTDYGNAKLSRTNWLWRVGPQFDITFLNLDGFGLYNYISKINSSLVHIWSRGVTTKFELPIRYQRFDRDEGDNPNTNRTGFALKPAITHQFFIGSLAMSIGANYDRVFAVGRDYRANAVEVPFRLGHPFFWGVYGASTVKVGKTFYPDSTNRRIDTVGSFNLNFSKKFDTHWNGSLGYGFKRSVSTVDSATYSKHTVSLIVTYAIL